MKKRKLEILQTILKQLNWDIERQSVFHNIFGFCPICHRNRTLRELVLKKLIKEADLEENNETKK